jgi:hypothetical protein
VGNHFADVPLRSARCGRAGLRSGCLQGFDSFPPQSTSDFSQLPLVNDGNGIAISRNTAVSLWRGERCDYGLASKCYSSSQNAGGTFPRERGVAQ